MFMAGNEIHSGEQMVQAFQWVDEIVRRLKAVWFTDLTVPKYFVGHL